MPFTLALLSWTPADWIHHLWQSSVIALALVVLMALCARFSARTRLALVWMALAKFALPFGLLAAVVTLFGGHPQGWLASGIVPAPAFVLERPMLAALTTNSTGTGLNPGGAPGAGPADMAAVLFGESRVSGERMTTWSWSQVLLLIWALGFATLLAWWIIGGRCLRRRLLGDAEALSLEMYRHLEAAAAKAGLRELPRCVAVAPGNSPGLLGIFFPILTLPAGLEKDLTRAELESVLLHELIHVRRRDPFWLAVHVTGVCALWFNPIAWLLGRWIRLETEKSCDERVLELTGHPDTYAQGILKVVHLALGLPPPSLVGAITPPVVSRVRNILLYGSHPDHRWLRSGALSCGVLLLALGGNTDSLAKVAEAPEFTPPVGMATTQSTPFSLLAMPTGTLPGAVISRLVPSQPTVQPPVLPSPGPLGLKNEFPETDSPAGPADPTIKEISPVDSSPKVSPVPLLQPVAEAGMLPSDFPAFEPDPEASVAPVQLLPADSLLLDQFAVSFSAAALPATPEGATTTLAGTTGPIVADLATPAVEEKVYAHLEVDTLPVALSRPSAEYPGSLKRAGIEGSATIALTVDARGQVRDVRSVRPTEHLFAQAAVDAVRQWIFLPGLKNGQPVATAMEVPFNFHIRPEPEPTTAMLHPSPEPVVKAAVAKPAASRSSDFGPGPAPRSRDDAAAAFAANDLDLIPKVTHQVEPVYPADLKRAGISGKATVSFVVDAKGNVKNIRPVDSSDRRFASAAMDAVGKWKFQPGFRDGEAVPTLVVIPITFNLSSPH
jgi:TonB family protein